MKVASPLIAAATLFAGPLHAQHHAPDMPGMDMQHDHVAMLFARLRIVGR